MPGCPHLQIGTLGLANNSLTGDAFPSSWLRPGSFPRLAMLDVTGNAGLAGTLPANLSWPALSTL